MGYVIAILLAALALFGIHSCNQSDLGREWARERAAAEQKELTPHVIREADGCKVYAFKAGDRYHYFTRCQDSRTTTESNYAVTCGKSCTKTETESIEVKR